MVDFYTYLGWGPTTTKASATATTKADVLRT
jgi:hypothetical protein